MQLPNKSLALILLILISIGITLPKLMVAQNQRAPSLILADNQERYPLGLHLDILEDPTGKLTITDVTSSRYSQQFRPSQDETPNFGLTQSVYWIRLQLKNTAVKTNEWRLEMSLPGMSFIELYRPEATTETGFSKKRVGYLLPFSTREVPHHHFIFELPLPKNQEQTIYMRFETDGAMLLPLTIWTTSALAQRDLVVQFIIGLFYGTILIMIGYNAFLFLALRDQSYLYLVIWIALRLLLIAAIDGRASQFLWPNLGAGNILMSLLLLDLVFIFLLQFATTFLQTKQYLPKWHPLLNGLMVGFGILIIPILLFTTRPLLILLLLTVIPLNILILIVAILVWRRGYTPARYFILSVLTLNVANAIEILIRIDVVPVDTFFGLNEPFAVTINVLLLSLALADRINLLRTETEQANHNLQESETRLTQFLDAMPVGVAVYNTEAKLEYTNLKTLQIFGISEWRTTAANSPKLSETMARYPFFITGTSTPYPLDKIPLVQSLQGQNATIDDLETEISGERVSLEIWAHPIFDEQGQVKYAVSAFQDITDRKKIEAEIYRYRTELETLVTERTTELAEVNELLAHDILERERIEEALRFQMTLLEAQNEATLDGVLVVSLDREWLFVNQQFIEMWDLPDEIVQSKSSKLALEHSKSKTLSPEQFMAAVEHLYQYPEAEIHDELVLKDGRIFDRYSAPIRSQAGQHYGRAWYYRDVTEKRQADQALQVAKEAAEAANKAKSQFLANMSHELRTPLSGILGYAQILRRDPTLNAYHQERLTIIQQSGEHLLSLINDLLDIAKIEAGKLELMPTSFHLPRMLERIMNMVRLRAEHKELEFRFEAVNFTKNKASYHLPDIVYGDAKRLRQVLINLLGNAIKFTDAGHVTFRVGLVENERYEVPKQVTEGLQPASYTWLRFEIEDSGAGIPTDQLKAILEPFHQAHNTPHQWEGTGLGLTICHSLIHAMGSRLQIESLPGQGSRFWFDIFLPILEDQPNPERKNKIKALVIDQVITHRDTLSVLLAPLGFDIIETDNGQDGLAKAKKHIPEVIIFDLMMAKMDGFEFVQQLRQLPRFENTTILATSANVFAENHQRSLAAGCNDFLPKPIQPEQLFATLQHHLNIFLSPASKITSLPKQGISGSSLIYPSQEKLVILQEAALLGDIQGIRRYLQELEEGDVQLKPFVQLIRQLTKEFQTSKIQQLIEKRLNRAK